MITASERRYLAGRAATARVQPEKDAARREALEVRHMLEEFSDRLHAYAKTQEGQTRALALQDQEWNEAKVAHTARRSA